MATDLPTFIATPSADVAMVASLVSYQFVKVFPYSAGWQTGEDRAHIETLKIFAQCDRTQAKAQLGLV